MKKNAEKKSSVPKIENNVFNIRLNKKFLFYYKTLGLKKYNIKTVSKFFSLSLKKYILHNTSINELALKLNSFNSVSIDNDKKFSMRISTEDLALLEELSMNLGLKITDCLRKLIYIEVLENFMLTPELSKIDLNLALSEDSFVKFYFRCNEDTIRSFLKLYSQNTGETNLTAALNDIARNFIKDYNRDSKELIIKLSKKSSCNINNDFKYNFSISKKRYLDFKTYCENIGIQHQECLRKAIKMYIDEHSSGE